MHSGPSHKWASGAIASFQARDQGPKSTASVLGRSGEILGASWSRSRSREDMFEKRSWGGGGQWKQGSGLGAAERDQSSPEGLIRELCQESINACC